MGLPAVLLVGFAGVLAYAAREVVFAATDVRVVPVVVKTDVPANGGAVAGGAVGVAGGTVQAAGWVEAAPYATAVTALADGVVREVRVLEGQAVKRGDAVAVLIDEDARLALARAEAVLAAAEAELTAAQRQWDHPVERTRAVDTAAATVAGTHADLARVDAEAAAEAARVEELAEQLRRVEEGFRARATSEIDVVNTRLKLQAQRAVLRAAEARRPVLEAQLAERQAELAAARQHATLRIDEARALATARAAVATAAAARDEAALRLRRMTVVAPAEGVVLSRHVEPGTKLLLGGDNPHSAVAVRLYDPAKLQVRVDVPLADAAKVGVGTHAQVVVGVLPERTFDGVVTRVVHEADVAKNTLQVKVAIDDPSPQIKPEMLARVRFQPSPVSSAAATTTTAGTSVGLFVPAALVRGAGDPGGAYVVAVDRTTGTAVRRPVVLGAVTRGSWVSVASGLNAGDEVIAGPPGVTAGTRVRVVGEAKGD